MAKETRYFATIGGFLSKLVSLSSIQPGEKKTADHFKWEGAHTQHDMSHGQEQKITLRNGLSHARRERLCVAK